VNGGGGNFMAVRGFPVFRGLLGHSADTLVVKVNRGQVVNPFFNFKIKELTLMSALLFFINFVDFLYLHH
jgi:hypothetical protein